MDDLIAYGVVQPGWLGIEVEDLSPELSSALSVSPGFGVLISKIWPGSPAEKAGLKPGMVIYDLDNKSVPSKNAFKDAMMDITRNDPIKVKYFEQGKEKEVAIRADDFPRQLSAELCWDLLGLEVGAATGAGVAITKIDPSSPAYKIGLGRGDNIMRLNQTQLANVTDFYQALVRNRNSNSVIIVIKREKYFYYVTLPLRG